MGMKTRLVHVRARLDMHLLFLEKGRSGPLWLLNPSPTEATLCWQDVSDQNSMDYPQLYKPGQLNLLFNKRKFFICMAHGIYTSSVLFFIPYGAFYSVAGEDGQHIADYQSFAVTMATSLVIVVSVQVTPLVKHLYLMALQLLKWFHCWLILFT